ncbi:MAG: cytochrome ubiquinol oxidase subunit I [Orrella sp.]
METTQLIFVQAQLGWALALFQGLFVLGLGLSWVLAIWQWLIGTNPQARHSQTFQSWLGIFSVVFRMVFGFGLVALMVVAINWPSLFERTGNVLGPALLALVVVAFLAKTVFFRVMMHQHGKVSEAVYTFSVLGLAVCYTAIVAGWVVMDVWLRDPVGASLIDGRFQVLDARAIFLNEQVSWQLAMTLLGALLATVGWLVARLQYTLSPKLYKGLCLLGGVAAVLIVPMTDVSVARLLPDGPSLVGLLMARDLSPTLPTAMTMVVVLRVTFVMALLYLTLMVIAFLCRGDRDLSDRHLNDSPPQRQGYVRYLPIGLFVLGPLLWAGLWLVTYLSKGNDVVVNHLSFADLVNSHSMVVLWISAGFLLLATVTIVVGLWHGLSDKTGAIKLSDASEVAA